MILIEIIVVSIFIIDLKLYVQLVSSSFNQIYREEIKAIMKNAWESYRKYAWGYDFLNPRSRHGQDWFGLGYTIIDSLDTLLLMNMTQEFDEATIWINNSFLPSLEFVGEVSFFETVIRSLGGLLTAYEQTNNRLFLNAAKSIGDKLLLAFKTPTGLPQVLINFRTGELNDHPWAQKSTLLSDVGSCQIEFLALSHHTGNKKYYFTSMDARDFLLVNGPLPPTHIYYSSAFPSLEQYSFDAFGDSYFEYLLKLKLYAPYNITKYDKPHEFRMALEAAMNQIAFTSWNSKHEYFTTAFREDFSHTISHLFFFLPGTLYLAASQEYEYNRKYFCKSHFNNEGNRKHRVFSYDSYEYEPNENINFYLNSSYQKLRSSTPPHHNYQFTYNTNSEYHFGQECQEDYSRFYYKLADALLDTAISLYKMQPTHLGGETAIFGSMKSGVTWSDDMYKLRPELVESLFYSWRLTRNLRSKKVAYKILKAIKKYCETDSGYTSIRDTSKWIVIWEDLQDSYFLSETLKYLYLIFSDNDVYSLDDYIFTTQAHPLKKLLFKD